jgi:hypothetical protein
LHVSAATSKETAPGIFLPNFKPVTGRLNGERIDVVRLYRFNVTRPRDLELDLMADSAAPLNLKLLNDQGRYLQCNCGNTGQQTIRRQLSPGRYFVVVEAHSFGSAQFTLTRKLRLITHVHVTFDSARYEQIAPARAIRVATHVTPSVDGPITIEIQRFDPVQRWQFYRAYHVRAIQGLAEIAFVPPHIGRWRAWVSYDGTKTASPATGGPAQALVGQAAALTAPHPRTPRPYAARATAGARYSRRHRLRVPVSRRPAPSPRLRLPDERECQI